MRLLPRLACLLLAGVVFAACDGTSDPEGVEGRYSAHAVNGRELPATVFASWSFGQEQVVDADVRLGEDGKASVELARRLVRPDSTVGPTGRTTYTGTFRQVGDRLEIGSLRSPDGLQVPAQGVVISPREIAVTLRFYPLSSTGYTVSIIARR